MPATSRRESPPTRLVGGFITNDPAVGGPNTLRIVFANQIHDVSFVYHQIGTWQASVFRAMLAGSTVDSFSYLGNQFVVEQLLRLHEPRIRRGPDRLRRRLQRRHRCLQLRDLHGSCTMRNGSNVNPLEYGCLTSPIIGTTWMGTVVIHPYGCRPGSLSRRAARTPGFPSPFGEVLVQLAPMPVLISGFGTFSVAIPTNESL